MPQARGLYETTRRAPGTERGPASPVLKTFSTSARQPSARFRVQRAPAPRQRKDIPTSHIRLLRLGLFDEPVPCAQVMLELALGLVFTVIGAHLAGGFPCCYLKHCGTVLTGR
jgi:hypothetical protein